MLKFLHLSLLSRRESILPNNNKVYSGKISTEVVKVNDQSDLDEHILE